MHVSFQARNLQLPMDAPHLSRRYNLQRAFLTQAFPTLTHSYFKMELTAASRHQRSAMTAAFIVSTARACSTRGKDSGPGQAAADPTRRQLLVTCATLAGAALLPLALTHGPPEALSEEARLPDGARQFSQVVASQRQWSNLAEAFANGRTPDEAEWNSIRGYLRAVYVVSADMEFLVRRWDRARRETGLDTVRKFRKEVRLLDRPAAVADADMFLKGHAEVVGVFDEFFQLMKQDTVGDMPAEL